MTDVQTWVREDGKLIPNGDYNGNSIDLTASSNPVPILYDALNRFHSNSRYVKYLSLARCELLRVPRVFKFKDRQNRSLASTVEYISLYGNKFISVIGNDYVAYLNATKTIEDPSESYTAINKGYESIKWSAGFKNITFPNLKELDLRACMIRVLHENVFQNMPRLEALYLAENKIHYIKENAFAGLINLIHLDLSNNIPIDTNDASSNLYLESYNIFNKLYNLTSLDLSFTKISDENDKILNGLGEKMKRLSLCETGIRRLKRNVFNGTSLKILDLSGNIGIFNNGNCLNGLQKTLQILYAEETGLDTFDIFINFTQLEILKVTKNFIVNVRRNVTNTLKNLQILDMDKNKIESWNTSIFSVIPKLKLLSLKDNVINSISREMISDLSNVTYLGLSGNFIVCNCFTRALFDLAASNEQTNEVKEIYALAVNYLNARAFATYHVGYNQFNNLVEERRRIIVENNELNNKNNNSNTTRSRGNFILIDYQPSLYYCLMFPEGKSVKFSEVSPCSKNSREMDYVQVIKNKKKTLLVYLVIPSLLLLGAFVYVLRRNFIYCFITIKNSALLSLIHKHDVIDADTIFHYDVFVSYCNDDRPWVLDHLLPQLESDSTISACLHERDFQVGLSILENIVTSLDRSRSIMLVISQKFLMSKWCQFEMHLAQHRLLETRREDLILVLLEEIPRSLRPNTLHYLMITKTYIVWPKDKDQRTVFWRRMKKSLLTQKFKHNQKVSLA